jgi:signal transduction histidine kinase
MRHTTWREPLCEMPANEEVVGLRSLTAYLITAQESERRRISREIHDDLIQRMGVLAIQLDQMDVASLRASIAGLTEDLHRICYGLHPVLLDNLGLSAAVEFLCEEYTRMRGFQVTFLRRGVPPISQNISLGLYRVVQEALHNVAKHAGADRATVVLCGSGNCIRVAIRDNGCGFDPTRGRVKNGLGLISIRERVRLLGGRCDIRTKPGSGVRIAVCVPLASAQNGVAQDRPAQDTAASRADRIWSFGRLRSTAASSGGP